MKTIGKILIAAVLVAMIVTSIITVAMAADSYTGDLATAQGLLDGVAGVDDADLNAKSMALEKVYYYLESHPVDPESAGYDAFETDLYLQSMHLAELYMDKLLGRTDGGKGVYALLAATELAENLLNKLSALEYAVPENPKFTGNVESASALIASLGETSSFAELKEGLAAAYGYLVATPVNPTTDNYVDFIGKYNELGDALIVGFLDSIDSSATPEAKIAALSSFRAYLTDTMISEKVVNAYNEKLAAVQAEYNAGLADAEPLNTLFGGEYTTNIENLTWDLDDAKFYLYDMGDTDFALEFLMSAYENLSTTLYDPSAVGENMFGETFTYYDLLEIYQTLCGDILDEFLINQYDSKTSLDDKYAVLVNFYKNNIESMPYAADAYNERRLELYTFVKEVASNIGNSSVTYIESVKPEPTVTEGVLYSLLADITNAYDEYVNAETGVKAAAFEDLKGAVASMIKLLSVSVIDTGADYYDGFVAAYDAARLDFVNAYLAMVDAAETEAKEDVLSEIKDFFNENPLSKSAIEAYNAKVAEVFGTNEAKVDEYKLTSVYFEIEELLAAITPTADFEENLENMRLLYAYYQRDYDVTDKAYTDFVKAYNEKDAMIADLIVAELNAPFSVMDANGVAAAVSACAEFLNEVQLKQAITQFKGAADRLVDYAYKIVKYVEDGDKIDAGEGDSLSTLEKNNALRAATGAFNYDAITELIAAYGDATDLEDKKVAFKAIYDELIRMRGEWKLSFEWDVSFSEILDEYETISTSLSNEIIAAMNNAGSVFEKFAALEEAKTFVYIVPYSPVAANIKDTYDALLNTLKSEDFSEFASQVATACPVLDYASPEGTEGDLSSLDAIADEYNVELDTMIDAYKFLSALNDGGKVVDFGKLGFVERINDFDEVKDVVCTSFIETVDDSFYSDRFEIFEMMYEILDENCMSEKMVEIYNEKRVECINIYTEFNETYLTLEAVINHFANYPVEPTALDAENAARYEAVSSEINAYVPFVKYATVKSAILVFNNATGDFADFNQKRALDIMKRYSESIEANACNDMAFVQKTLSDMFKSLIEGLEGDAIDSCGTYIIENKFPQYLVDIYNAEFEKTLTAAETEPATKTGEVGKFISFVNGFNAAPDIEEKGNVLTEIVNYLNENPISDASIYSNIVSAIKTAKEDYYRAVNEKKEELLNKANIIDLSFAPTAKMDGSKLTKDGNYFTSGSGNLVGKGYSFASQVVEVYNEDGTIKEGAQYENKYVNVSTLNAAPYWWQQNGYNPAGGYTYDRGTSGLVIDFDVMAPENLNFRLFLMGVEPTELKRKEASYSISLATFKDNALLYQSGVTDPEFSGYKDGVDEQIAVTPGEWTHVTAIVNGNEGTVELLINYVSLGTKAISPSGTLGTFNPELLRYTLLQVCFGEVGLETGRDPRNTYCYDNVRITRGTSYHDDDKFAAMSDGEKFKFFVNRLANENDTAINRLYAYQEASALINSVSGAEYNTYKATCNNFDLDTVTAAAYQEHYDFVEEMFEIYDPIINTENSAYNKIVFDMVNDYLDYQRKYINFSDDKIMEISAKIWEIENKFKVVNNTNDLVTTMKQFYRATTLASLERHYENVKANYAKFEDRNEYDLAMQDVAVTSFFATLEKDDPYVKALKENGTGMTIDLFYFDYAPYRIEKQLRIENSKAIVDSIGFIEEIDLDKDDFANEEEYYEKFFGLASPYINAVSSILQSGKYNAEADGVAEAVQVYNLLEDKFYEITQTKHLNVIGEQLEKYAATDSYIEKLGVCVFVESYIEENNVDMSGEVGVEYMNTLAAYRQEIDAYKDVYAGIVAQNTKAFIDLVTKMEAYVTYKELKPLYEEGIEKYYYSMNVDSAEAKAAIEKFDAYGKFLEDAEYNSKMFIEHVSELKKSRIRQSQLYRALVNCTLYLDGVNEDIAGVTDALEVYNEKLAAYNATIDAVNGGISDSTTVVCSLRSTSVGATILAIIKNIFTK